MPDEAKTFTAREKLAVASEEARYRETHFTDLLDRQLVTKEWAEHQIGVMKAIAADYQQQVDALDFYGEGI